MRSETNAWDPNNWDIGGGGGAQGGAEGLRAQIAAGNQANAKAQAIEIDRLRAVNAELRAALKGVELLARVNAPIYSGSPAHTGILALLREIGEDEGQS